MQVEHLVRNPVTWVHTRLQGGWGRALTIGIVYLVCTIGLLIFTYRVSFNPHVPAFSTKFSSASLRILACVQGAMLLFGWSIGIRKAVQRDFTSGMIESHRLMPLSGWTTVLGYLTGPNINLPVLTLANFLLALGLCIYGQQDIMTWTIGLLLLVVPGLLVACLTLLLSLCSKGSSNIIGLLVILGITGGAVAVLAVPGLGLLAGVLTVGAASSGPGGAVRPDPWLFVSLLGQLVLAVILCAASARKVLRADVQAFEWRLALLVVAFASTFAGLGLNCWPAYESSFDSIFGGVSAPPIQAVASLSLLAILCLLPVGAAAQSAAREARRRSFEPDVRGRRLMNYAVVLLLATAIVVFVLWLTIGNAKHGIFYKARAIDVTLVRSAITIVLIFGLALLPLGALMRFVYRFSERAAGYVFGWLALTWGLPAAADVIRMIYTTLPDIPPAPSALMGVSPPGAWALLLLAPGVPVWPGIIVQAILALLMCIGPTIVRRRT